MIARRIVVVGLAVLALGVRSEGASASGKSTPGSVDPAVRLELGGSVTGTVSERVGRSVEFALTKASWDRERFRLKVEGKAQPGTVVTVTSVASGTLLGSASASREGKWLVVKSSPAPVPCRVRATANGQHLQRSVENAPSNCDATATKSLSGLSVSGPGSVDEGGTAVFVATATYSDGSTQDVTAAAAWAENSAYAAITGGVLTTAALTADQVVTVTASYTYGSITKSASKDVTIVNLPPMLVDLSISGPATVDEGSSARFVATATFADGSTQDVSSAASWSDDSEHAAIGQGVLTAGQVGADEQVIVMAAFSTGGLSEEASVAVTILDRSALTGSHAGRFAFYEGTKTCLTCHLSEATAMHGSVHYQWQGDASEAVGLSTSRAGKLGGINDFCIYPDINWIGKLTNLDGQQVDGGCARCHAGLGSKPAPEPTQAQLENIDCLLCHSKSYKRTVAQVDGVWRFVADTAAMPVSLQQAAVDITKPDSGTCLNCHTKAGGGNNFKRGDIEEAHRAATASFDVHMAPRSAGGAGLSCLSCHISVGHRIAGRGTDMRERDLPDRVACANCHSRSPHDDAKLDKHTARVSCTVCHIPEFAKVAATDMHRDYSAPADIVSGTRLFEPHMLMASHVRPVYRFFNGTSQFYEFGAEAVPEASGRVVMSKPLGSINDPGAQIIALKQHTARQPIDPVTRRLLPLKIGVFFQTGDLATAVKQGAAGVGWPDNGFEFAETERLMGVYHEVAQEDDALECASCHGGGRMDFAALGYTPLQTRNGKPLCSSCHGAKSGDFFKIHEKHVTDKRYDCSTCHTFSKAQ